MAEEFNIVNCQENQDSLFRLIRLIGSGRSVLFHGSGPSRNFGYPSWELLIDELSTLIEEQDKVSLIKRKILNGELLIAAEILKKSVPEEKISELLFQIFKPKKFVLEKLHHKLVKLKFKTFVTTNYDPLIEQALNSIQNPNVNYGLILDPVGKSKLHSFIVQLVNDNSLSVRYQLYLHGRFDNPSSIVLSYSDYSKKYDGLDLSKEDLYEELLKGNIDISSFEEKTQLKTKGFKTIHFKIVYLLFLTQKIIFIGFGLRDPYLNKIIEEVKEDFDPYNPSHFALFSSEEGKNLNLFEYQDLKRYWRERGIDLIFYDDDPSYQGLEKFIDRFPPDCFIHPKSFQPKETMKDVESKAETSQNDLKSIIFSKSRKTINEIKSI